MIPHKDSAAVLVLPNTMICEALPFHVKSWTGFERLPFNGACPMSNRLTTSPKSPPFWRPAFCVFRAESLVEIRPSRSIVCSTVRAVLGVMWPPNLRFPGHERLMASVVLNDCVMETKVV